MCSFGDVARLASAIGLQIMATQGPESSPPPPPAPPHSPPSLSVVVLPSLDLDPDLDLDLDPDLEENTLAPPPRWGLKEGPSTASSPRCTPLLLAGEMDT